MHGSARSSPGESAQRWEAELEKSSAVALLGLLAVLPPGSSYVSYITRRALFTSSDTTR